jgi:hypothetical protein
MTLRATRASTRLVNPAHRQHAARIRFAQDSPRAEQRARQHPRRRDALAQALAAQAFHRQRAQRHAMLRHDPVFHAAFRAQPQHWHVACAQRRRDREAGEDVAAGATGHDQHGRLHVAHACTSSRVGSMRLRAARGSSRVFGVGGGISVEPPPDAPGRRVAIRRASSARWIS